MSTIDDGPKTPIQGSGTYPLLQMAAQETADQLDRCCTSEAAKQLSKQLRAIAALFQSWGPQNRPTDQERGALHDELIESFKKSQILLEKERSPQ